MAGDRVNPGKDILEIETFDGDLLVDKKVKYRHGMARSEHLGVQLRQVRTMPVYRQHDLWGPAVKDYSVIHLSEEPVGIEHGDGWEINRMLPATSHESASKGERSSMSAIAQTLLFVVGLGALLFTGWQTWELSNEGPTRSNVQVEIPAGTSQVDAEVSN